MRVLLLPMLVVSAAAWQPVGLAVPRQMATPVLMQQSTPDKSTPEPSLDASSADESAAAPSTSNRFDLSKTQDKSGAGFNQFDPVLSLSGFVSRRFGLAGGLAVVALLAATEGNEILKSLNDSGPAAGSGETVTTASGLQYVDVLIGTRGDTPLPGTVVGFNAVVTIGDKVRIELATPLLPPKRKDCTVPVCFKVTRSEMGWKRVSLPSPKEFKKKQSCPIC